MAHAEFKRGKGSDIFCLCAVVQICAVGAAITTAPSPSLFLYHLSGFTTLLQGAVILSRGLWWCLHRTRRKFNTGDDSPRNSACLIFLSGCVCLVAGGSVLFAYGNHLPGSAGDLPLAAQLVGAAAVIILSLYVAALQHRNRYLYQDVEKIRQFALTQRLRHHFLFNALNTTVCLIGIRPDVASNNLTDLSQLFRVMLKQKPMVTLMEEIRFVRRYLRIERARLGERLNVEWNLPAGDVLGEEIPSMVIQPLVENAIYHGIEAHEGFGVIRITIAPHHGRILFDIRNPVGGISASDSLGGNRLAQKNVSEKLFRVYGAGSRLDCQQCRGEYRAAFSIPRKYS